jgi:hypothetical protein
LTITRDGKPSAPCWNGFESDPVRQRGAQVQARIDSVFDPVDLGALGSASVANEYEAQLPDIAQVSRSSSLGAGMVAAHVAKDRVAHSINGRESRLRSLRRPPP